MTTPGNGLSMGGPAVEPRGCPDPSKAVRFRDDELQAQFRRDGYALVPFLEPAAVEELRSLWDEVGPTEIRGIYSNVHDLAPEVNRRIDATITRLFAAPAHRVFVNGHLGGATFLVKGTGPDSSSTLHQDWNNVEEPEAQSLSIWCPLVDVDEHNGALQVLPGSHHARPSIRSIDTPSLYLDFGDGLEPHLRHVPARAGDAVLYAHNLFHGSKPNLGGEVRVSVVSGVLPDQVRNVHYRRAPASPRGTFEILEVERRFFFEGIPELKAGRLPTSARPVGRVYVPDHELRIEDVLECLSERGPSSGA